MSARSHLARASRFIIIIATVLIGGHASVAHGQSAALSHDLQAWALVTAQGKMGEGAGLYFLEVQPRASLQAAGLDQTLLRAAVGMRLMPWMSVWAGAGFMPGHDAPAYLTAEEGRVFQQITLAHEFFGVAWQSRSRFEQRALAGMSAVSLRARTLARAAIPLWDESIYLPVWDELFMNFNDVSGGPQRGFDQNRAFAGLGYRIDPARGVGLEAGYLNRVTRTRMDHALFVWLSFNP